MAYFIGRRVCRNLSMDSLYYSHGFSKILAVSDPELLAKLKAYSAKLKKQVEAKDAKLKDEGYKAYLDGMKK